MRHHGYHNTPETEDFADVCAFQAVMYGLNEVMAYNNAVVKFQNGSEDDIEIPDAEREERFLKYMN